MLSFQPNKDDLFDSIKKTHPILRLRSNIHSYYTRTLLQGLVEENRLAKVEVFDPAIGSMELTANSCVSLWDNVELLPYLKHCCYDNIQKTTSQIGQEDIEWRLYWLRVSEETYNEPQVLSILASLSERIRDSQAHVRILLTYDAELPVPLRPWCGTVELSIPRGKQLNDYVHEVLRSLRASDGNETSELKAAVQGLDAGSIYEVLHEAVAESREIGGDGQGLLDAIRHRRDVRLRQYSGLEVLRSSVQKEDIGGLKYLIRYLEYQSRIISNKDLAKRAKVDLPKGILLVGLPGCGKSLAAMAAASIMKLPLLRLEIGALMGRFLGESEKNLRDAIRSAEGAAPCILWVDELEKALGGMAGNSDDGGTGKRMLALLLTWMQEQQHGVYIVATANAVEQLPPELLRRGRFDETFRVELPNPEERKEILRIHLTKRGERLSQDALEKAAREVTEGCNGADIEALVKEAKQRRWIHDGRSLQLSDLKEVKEGGFTPLSKQWKGKIDEMLNQLKKQGFRNASEEPGTPLPPPMPILNEENLPLPKELEQLLNIGQNILLRIGNNPGWTIKLTQEQERREAWIANGLLQDIASEMVEIKGALFRQKQILRLRFSKDQKNFEPGSDLPNIKKPILFSKEDDGRVRIQFEDMCGEKQDLRPVIEVMKESVSFLDPNLWPLLYGNKPIRWHNSDNSTVMFRFEGEGVNRLVNLYKVDCFAETLENAYIPLASGDGIFLLPIESKDSEPQTGYKVFFQHDKNKFRVILLEENQVMMLRHQGGPILENYLKKTELTRFRRLEFTYDGVEYLIIISQNRKENGYQSILSYQNMQNYRRDISCTAYLDAQDETWTIQDFKEFNIFHHVLFYLYNSTRNNIPVDVDGVELPDKGSAEVLG